jgi:type II restriction enzyme
MKKASSRQDYEMKKRNFNDWLKNFKHSISTYSYYVDFSKVYKNVNAIKIELNILNSLIGSRNIKLDFINLIKKYPETIKCIPILLAVRANEIYAIDKTGEFNYNFYEINYPIEQYAIFMKKTGLFDLISNHIINNLYDYITGVETGLDSNGRKNRGGHLMENIVEEYLNDCNVDYYKEMYLSEIENKWSINLSKISNQGKSEKRFDFVVKTQNTIYGIETNFYTGGGSKLNETARSYKTIAQEAVLIKGFEFVWFTDGEGWNSARNNLEETFDVMEHIYNINDMKDGIMKKIFV